MILPNQALDKLEDILRSAANDISVSTGRHTNHLALFTVLSEILPLQTLHDNISIVMNNLKQGLKSQKPEIQQSVLQILNTLLHTDYTLDQIQEICENI